MGQNNATNRDEKHTMVAFSRIMIFWRAFLGIFPAEFIPRFCAGFGVIPGSRDECEIPCPHKRVTHKWQCITSRFRVYLVHPSTVHMSPTCFWVTSRHFFRSLGLTIIPRIPCLFKVILEALNTTHSSFVACNTPWNTHCALQAVTSAAATAVKLALAGDGRASPIYRQMVVLALRWATEEVGRYLKPDDKRGETAARHRSPRERREYARVQAKVRLRVDPFSFRTTQPLL